MDGGVYIYLDTKNGFCDHGVTTICLQGRMESDLGINL